MAEGRWRIHQRQDETIPSSIGSAFVQSLTVSVTGIVSAAPTSLTVISLSYSDGARPQTVVNTFSTTATATTTSSNARATAANVASASATSDAKTSSSNLSTLIPAIVAPVAAVFIISFVAFWLFMRRRQKKAIENEPEFVMEGMKEKPRSRPITADSNSSTQELVPNKNKETAVHVREVEKPVLNTFAPPRTESAADSRPGSRQTDASGKPKAVPNFSRGPRPNTAGRDAAPSPAPGFGPHTRGASREGPRPPTAPAGSRSNQGPKRPGQDGPPPRAGPSRPHPPRTGSFSRPLPPNTTKPPPATIFTGSNRPSQDGGPGHPPAGAYNGSSPISQYSPIVKDMPKFGTSPMVTRPNTQPRPTGGSISSINDQGNRKPPPSAIKTGVSPISPADPNFSEENRRIARLASNSRFHSVVTTTSLTSPATEEPPTPSPRLPPPATRDAPPVNYNIPLPTHEPPAPASIQARLNGASISDRRSVVSGLSDDYVDMEVDNKSDVSSLDEREKWQMQSENDTVHSQQTGLGGYGGLGPRPPLLSSDSRQNSGPNDSQYSLGYYGRDHSSH